MKKQMIVLLAVMLLIPAVVLAHGGHKHKTIMGTVQSIDASRIDLRTKDGKREVVPLAKGTMFMRGQAMVNVADVKPGTRVVIVLGEDDKTAQNVKLGVTKKN